MAMKLTTALRVFHWMIEDDEIHEGIRDAFVRAYDDDENGSGSGDVFESVVSNIRFELRREGANIQLSEDQWEDVGFLVQEFISEGG